MSALELADLLRKVTAYDFRRGKLVSRNQATHCRLPACRKPTREGKPYCQDHVLEHDYAAKVAAEADLLERARATRLDVGADDLLRDDMRSWLMQRPQSTRFLKRHVGLRANVIALAMLKDGEVKRKRSRRGDGAIWSLVLGGREAPPAP